MRNLRSANLNLLPILRVLLRYRHVTHAARALNVSQSSVSEALGKLRHLFNDELLVSRNNQMVLTALAQRLEPLVEASLGSVGALVGPNWSAGITPKAAIDIAASDHLILTLGTGIISRVRAERPELAIRFHEVDPRSIGRLRSGELDFMLAPRVSVNTSDARLERRLIFEDPVVCMVDEASPLQGRVPEESYWAAPHVFYSPRLDGYSASRATVLQQLGERRDDATLVQSYLLLPFFVEGTDAIALVHESLAKRLAPAARVRILEAPIELIVRIELAWDGSREQNPLQSWFLDIISDVAETELARLGRSL